jgi:hypothetical protein
MLETKVVKTKTNNFREKFSFRAIFLQRTTRKGTKIFIGGAALTDGMAREFVVLAVGFSDCLALLASWRLDSRH